MTTVALDGRGAERGPAAIVAGARAAAADGIARARVRRSGTSSRSSQGVDGVELVAAAAEITNDEDPVGAVRETPEASIVLAAADVAEGRSQALASAGPTGRDDDRGAVRAAARCTGFAARRSRSSSRSPDATRPPACCSTSAPTPRCAPATWSSSPTSAPPSAAPCSGSSAPRVALLSVGEEPKKGTQDVVDAHAELDPRGGDRLPRQHRGPRPARRRRRRRRHRRLHRQRRAEDDRGHREGGRRRGRRRGALEPARRRRRPAAAPGARRPAPPDGPRHHRRRDPARTPRGRRRRPRELGPRGDRERDPARGAGGRGRGGRADGGAAASARGTTRGAMRDRKEAQ